MTMYMSDLLQPTGVDIAFGGGATPQTSTRLRVHIDLTGVEFYQTEGTKFGLLHGDVQMLAEISKQVRTWKREEQ